MNGWIARRFRVFLLEESGRDVYGFLPRGWRLRWLACTQTKSTQPARAAAQDRDGRAYTAYLNESELFATWMDAYTTARRRATSSSCVRAHSTSGLPEKGRGPCCTCRTATSTRPCGCPR